MRKFLLLTLLASLPMIGMNAQHSLRMYGEDISMGVGEKPTMFINLDVDKDEFYHISKFTIVLPEGFSVTKNNRGKFIWTANTNRQDNISIANTYFEDGNYFNIIVSPGLNDDLIYTPMDENDYWYIKANIEADATVTSGTYEVLVKNVTMTSDELVGDTHDPKEYSLPDFTFNIVYSAAPKSFNLTMASFSEMATMYLDFPVDIPNDVLGVYYVSGVEGNTLTMYEIENKIPANTPVIVMANPGTTHTFTESTGTIATITDNLLKGVLEETSVSSLGGTIYTLGRGKNSSLLGFHKYTGTTLGANKAYMTRDNSNVNSFNLAFPDGSTFIHSLQAEGDQDVYDLQGRKVEKVTRGVYIIDGVKTVVK